MSTQENNMSWLGNGLSQITGQISNFTKEVLTEGTEEVDDHATELRVTKKRLVDVEGLYIASRAELDRLKHLNDELVDKLHEYELHTSVLSTEYRQKLNERDLEVQQLKQQHHSLLEAQSELAVASTPGSAVPGFSNFQAADAATAAFGGDEHDFDDVISGQQRINRLQRETERLAAECRHWKHVASRQTGSSGEEAQTYNGNVADLHTRIKDLEQQLSREIDDHQKQLAALQNLHADKLSSQAHNQAKDQQRLQAHIEELKSQIENNEKSLTPEREETTNVGKNEVMEDAKLDWMATPLSSTPIGPRHGTRAHIPMELSELSETNKQLTDEVDALRAQVASHQEEISQFDLVRSDLTMEKEALEAVLVNLRANVKYKDEQPHEIESAESSQYDDIIQGDCLSEEKNVEVLKRQIEVLSNGKLQLEGECENLHDEKEELQQKVSELESQVSKLFAADSKCLTLQAELEERTEEFNRLQHEVVQQDDQLGQLTSNYDENFESIIEKEAEIAELEEHLQSIELENKLLKEERDQHFSTEDVNEEIIRMREELREQKKEIEYLHGKEEQLKFVTMELQERESTFKYLEEEKKMLETSLDELDSQQQDAIAAIMESKEKLAKSNEKLRQKNLELETEVANISQSHDLELETVDLEEALVQSHEEVHQLEEENKKLIREMKELMVKLDQSGLALNNLHMDKQELENTLKGYKLKTEEQNTSVSNISAEKRHLETIQKEQQMQIKQMKDDMVSTSNIQTGLQDDLESLRKELNVSQNKVREYSIKEKSFKTDIARLQDQLSNSEKKNQQLQDEVSQSSIRLAEQAKSYEEYIREINTAKEFDANSLQDNHRKLMEENHQSEMKISELEIGLQQHKTTAENLQDQLQRTIEDHEEMTVLFSEKESEVSALKAEYEAKQQYAEEKMIALKALHTPDASTTNLDSQQKASQLNQTIQDLHKTLSSKELALEGFEAYSIKLKQQLDDQITLFENNKVKHKHETMTHSEKIESLESQLNTKDSDLNEALDSLNAFKSQKDGNTSKVRVDQPNMHNIEMMNNKDIILREDRQEGLSMLVAQKDDVIKELRNNNSSLLKLLEERSLQLHGNRSVVDIHKLQNELRGQKLEKEQIMSVLNDKTRECSSLKSEVHKLMNVISAEKTALSKLQKDNQELIKINNSPKKEVPNSDMTREAIKNLSMVIRDKDLEIEALTQKNQTLLQVMQQNPEAGAQMASILQERENMIKQLEYHQKDRELIIIALNQKHQESVAYHNEIQRLLGVTSVNNGNHESLEQEFTSLQQQYEDKQQALLKLQNELLNYKQKFAEVDAKYKEILHRQAQQVQNKVQQGPPLPAVLVNKDEECTKNSDRDTELSEQAAMTQYQQHITHLNNLVQQRKEEIVNLTDQIHHLRLGIQEKDRAITEHQRNLVVKEQVVKDKEAVITARNLAISEANTRVREAHEQMRKKDMDMSALRKQMDNLTFHARGLQTELNDLILERDNALDHSEGVRSERTQLAEANARLSAAIGERDLEMNAMREKVATLTAAVREACEKGEVEQMLADTEAMQKAAQVLQAERDQAYASLQAVQADNMAFKQQNSQLLEREQKLQRELDRLRSHLLTIEEGYTQDAMAAEEREKELRNRLAAAEENIAHSSNAVQNYSVEANRQVESLQEQLTVIAEQRDHAMLQLSSASDTASQYAASLTNLQMVLEQFQKEREEQQSVETERYQRHLLERSKQLAEALEDNQSLKARMAETTDALEAAQRLSEQLDRKQEAMVALKEEVKLREDALTKAEAEIERLTTSSEAKVDKLIIKNLLLGYFHTPANKQPEVLTLLGKVLSFSQDEMQQVGANGSNVGWLTNMFRRRSRATPTPPATPNRAASFFTDQSFSEMFVKFLERESSPQPKMRLPAEAMAREQQEKHRLKTPTFNPFSAPASSLPASPSMKNAQPDNHLLLKPMSNTMPMFSPIIAPSVGSGLGEMSPPGHRSATSSGRSTPASVILKDVLQQQ